MIKKYKHMREDFSESDFTPEEKEIYKSVLGEYTSDEELSKITVPNI